MEVDCMDKETGLTIEINVTKIVKYVCIAGMVIVTVIFGGNAFKAYINSRS